MVDEEEDILEESQPVLSADENQSDSELTELNEADPERPESAQCKAQHSSLVSRHIWPGSEDG